MKLALGSAIIGWIVLDQLVAPCIAALLRRRQS